MDPLPQQLDLVCANLPYLGKDANLPAEVVAQPERALFAGEGGTELNARLLAAAPERLQPGGAILVELDAGGEPRLAELSGRLYAGHRLHRDGAGNPRFLEAWTS
jgi:methylase of polypeptide subunit release factors